jgi:tRNA A-37 threonylcarbamoyl transferase component Bud32
MTDLVGQSIGPYTITGRLGSGGMADVYKAFHAGLSVHRALKIIRPELSLAEDFRVRFQKEARSVAALRHQNIVQVHDFGMHESSYYMVMEFIEGQDLKKILRAQGRIRPIRDAVELIVQVASALEYAHGQGLIHRDIKPENIMVTDSGQPILTDFGIAKLVTGGTKLTQTGSAIGTPAYMAPEQALGTAEIGPSADVYALTIVLFELLTGRTPFDADTPVAAILKTISDPLPMPQQIAPDIGDAIQGVIIKGTAKQPSERYPSISSLRAALVDALQRDIAFASDQPTLVHPQVPSTARQGASRRAAVWVAVAGVALAFGAGAMFWNGTTTVPEAASGPVTADTSAPLADAVRTAAAPPAESATVTDSVRGAASLPSVTAPEQTQMIATATPEPAAKQASPPSARSVARTDAVVSASGTPAGSTSTDAPATVQTMAVAPPIQLKQSSGSADQVRKGETTQTDLIRLFGGPNLTTLDAACRETWIYERTQTQTDVRTSSQVSQAAGRLGLFFGPVDAGAAAGQARSSDSVTTTSSVRSVTVVVTFSPDRTVYDYTVRETYL